MKTPAKKKVFILGANGTVGRVLKDALAGDYDLVLSDKEPRGENADASVVQIDVTNYDDLLERTPESVDTIINLTALPECDRIVDAQAIKRMSALYVVGSYNVFMAAVQAGVRKVVFASTNHVTESYEKDGKSTLDREITPADFPDSASVYGAMKFCAERLGVMFSREYGLSVISLRIGTVRQDEVRVVQRCERTRRTLLSKTDTVDVFRSAIETSARTGVYYAVSDNPGRPWSIRETIRDLGFKPTVNSRTLFDNTE